MPDPMMPPPEEVAAFVDRAEDIVRRGAPYWTNGGLMRLPAEDRRRLLAWAVFEHLRHDWDGASTPETVPA